MIVDITGRKYGRLTVIRRSDSKIQKCITWDCRCDCGQSIKVKGKDLKSGKIKECKTCKKKNDDMVDFEKIIDYGIYGIYVEDNLYYIGMTMRDFKERFSEHIAAINNKNLINSQQKFLYAQIRTDESNGKEYEFKIIENCGEKKLSKKEVELLEEFAIKIMKPKYNYCGVKVPYKY